MNDTGVYIVSPPTLYLPERGMSITLVSNSEEWQTEVITLVEKLLNDDQVTFFVGATDFKDPKAWIWYWHVAKNCDLVLCDTKSATEHERYMCFSMLKDSMPVIFHTQANTELSKLLKATHTPAYDDIDDLKSLLENALGIG
jgi:hypothetical protein